MTATNAVPSRTVRARRIRFSYPSGSLNRHYVQGDLVMSHVVAVLSAFFPEGEDFFVRSVKHYADRVTDPELKTQVAGFIGQEVTHGREHRALNDRLHDMGYLTWHVDHTTRRVLRLIEKRTHPMVPLALTAAMEHYTATLAETLLTEPKAQALLGSTEVRSMLLWHALEESEHRAVAFDVFRAAGGSERLRIRAMRIMSTIFLVGTVLFTIESLLRDRATYNPRRLGRSLAQLRHSPFLARRVWRRVVTYNVEGFHPDDVDNTELLERWRAELFGADGALADHLR